MDVQHTKLNETRHKSFAEKKVKDRKILGRNLRKRDLQKNLDNKQQEVL